jgi:hypothetical protein
MLASYPASILNHIPPPSGIPFDSFKTGNALEGLRPHLSNNDLTLRSAPQERVSKGGHEHRVRCPSFETALRASSG